MLHNLDESFFVTPAKNLDEEGQLIDPTQYGVVSTIRIEQFTMDDGSEYEEITCLVPWEHQATPPFSFEKLEDLARWTTATCA
jgi:hypothetical protein